MDRIIIDELSLEELNEGDMVIIEKDKIIDDTICVILNDKEYCILEELCFYIYEGKEKPHLYKLKNNMTFYKLATAEYSLIKEYESKLVGDING